MLTLKMLRAANIARLPVFKNARGEYAHEKLDGSDWSLAEWFLAVTGELGEAANILKKFNRSDFSEETFRELFADELADVIIYLDILAHRADIDLETAIVTKWNATSARMDCPLRINPYTGEVQ